MDRVKILVRVTVRAGVRVAVRGSRGVAPRLEWSWLLLCLYASCAASPRVALALSLSSAGRPVEQLRLLLCPREIVLVWPRCRPSPCLLHHCHVRHPAFVYASLCAKPC